MNPLFLSVILFLIFHINAHIYEKCDIFNAGTNYTFSEISTTMGVIQTVYLGNNGCKSRYLSEKIYKRTSTCICTSLCCEKLFLIDDGKKIVMKYYSSLESCKNDIFEDREMQRNLESSKCYYNNQTKESYFFEIRNDSSLKSWSQEAGEIGEEMDYFFVKKLYHESTCPQKSEEYEKLVVSIYKSYAPLNEHCPMSSTCFYSLTRDYSHFVKCEEIRNFRNVTINSELAMQRILYVSGISGGIFFMVFVFYFLTICVFVACYAYKYVPKTKHEWNDWMNRYYTTNSENTSSQRRSRKNPYSMRKLEPGKQYIFDRQSGKLVVMDKFIEKKMMEQRRRRNRRRRRRNRRKKRNINGSSKISQRQSEKIEKKKKKDSGGKVENKKLKKSKSVPGLGRAKLKKGRKKTTRKKKKSVVSMLNTSTTSSENSAATDRSLLRSTTANTTTSATESSSELAGTTSMTDTSTDLSDIEKKELDDRIDVDAMNQMIDKLSDDPNHSNRSSPNPNRQRKSSLKLKTEPVSEITREKSEKKEERGSEVYDDGFDLGSFL